MIFNNYSRILIAFFLVLFFNSCQKDYKTLWLDELNYEGCVNGWKMPQTNKNLLGNPLIINGKKFERGIATHSHFEVTFELDGNTERFSCWVGLDDNIRIPAMKSNDAGTVVFKILTGDKELYNSGLMRPDMDAKSVDIDLKGVKILQLVLENYDLNTHHDHGNWVDAKFTYSGNAPKFYKYDALSEKIILTPKQRPEPIINSPKQYGARPGNPFLYKIPATGEKPIKYSVQNLPKGLIIDENSGVISGTIANKGNYYVKLIAENAKGKAEKYITFVAGNRIGLTPPLGYNSWNIWGLNVSQEIIKKTANLFVEKGLIDYGYTYINIDDGWEGKRKGKDSVLMPNEKFPDMKELCDYVHSKGLKIGIYSSPGKLTCGGFEGSYGFEEIDAKTWADWGIDYLKYDYCSYFDIVNRNASVDSLKIPYIVMNNALNKNKRDIIYSLCQYGMGKVHEWGDNVGGNLWRTTGDIVDTWNSMSELGFNQKENQPFAKPGNFNDPDMLVVGVVGWNDPKRQSRLTPNEQYTHVSLWSLLSSPLLIGADLTQLDDFTMGLITNNEVIAINQDSLAMQAKQIYQTATQQIWLKNLEDGSIAVGLFNLGIEPVEIVFDAQQAGFSEKFKVRDVWRQQDLGEFSKTYSAKVGRHGVFLMKLSK